MWPPTTIVAFGWWRRTSSHMSFTLPTFGRMPLMPTTSYGTVRISSSKRSRVGKSRSVVGASRFAWMSIRPHERWNMRSENGALHPRDLVVVELHRVDGAAAVLVVAGVGAEDAREQHARAGAERVAGDGEYAPCFACSTRPAGRPSEFCHIARA